MRSLTCNQWSDFKMGVMWVCFLDNVMIRAAAFWSLCSMESWVCGKLNKIEFPKSSLEDIKAWTNFSVEDRFKYFLMKPILRSWYLTDLQILEIWLDIVILQSSITPRLRQVWDTLIVIPEKEMEFMSILLNWVFEPNNRNSDLAEFNFKECEFNHEWTSFIAFLRWLKASKASAWLGLKEIYNWISSAYMW